MAGDAEWEISAKLLERGVFDRIVHLQNKGLSTCPHTIPGLIQSACQDNVPFPDVASQQRRFVLLNPGDERAVGTPHPAMTTVHFMESPTEIVSHPVITTLEITEAAANFWCPVVARRRIKPVFKVKVAYAAPEPVSFICRVQAHSVCEDKLADMDLWALSLDQEEPYYSMANSSMQEQISVGRHSNAPCSNTGYVITEQGIKPTPDWDNVYIGQAVFTFNKLLFESPSNLKPRWIVFSVGLPCGKAIAYTQFKLPTIVLSRRSDQERRAMIALCGEGNIPMEVFWSRSFQYCVDQFFAKTGLKRRGLTQKDYEALAERSGFNQYKKCLNGDMEYSVEALESTIKEYLQGIAHMLFLLKDQFDRVAPQTIAGFDVTRQKAELLLMAQEPSVFLLRFGSEIGTLVLSVVKRDGILKTVEHIRIRLYDIKRYKLENLVAQCGYAKMLLDVSTMHMYACKHALASDYEHTTVAAHLGLLTPNLCAAGELAIAGLYGIPASIDMEQRIAEREQLAFHAQMSAAKQLTSVARAAEYIGQLQTILNDKIQSLHGYEMMLRYKEYRQSFGGAMDDVGEHPLQPTVDIRLPVEPRRAEEYNTNGNIAAMGHGNQINFPDFAQLLRPQHDHQQLNPMVPVSNAPNSSVSAVGSGSDDGGNRDDPLDLQLPVLEALLQQQQQQVRESDDDIAMSVSPRQYQPINLAAMAGTPLVPSGNIINSPFLEMQYIMPQQDGTSSGRVDVEYGDMIDIDEASDEHVRNFLTL